MLFVEIHNHLLPYQLKRTDLIEKKCSTHQVDGDDQIVLLLVALFVLLVVGLRLGGLLRRWGLALSLHCALLGGGRLLDGRLARLGRLSGAALLTWGALLVDMTTAVSGLIASLGVNTRSVSSNLQECRSRMSSNQQMNKELALGTGFRGRECWGRE